MLYWLIFEMSLLISCTSIIFNFKTSKVASTVLVSICNIKTGYFFLQVICIHFVCTCKYALFIIRTCFKVNTEYKSKADSFETDCFYGMAKIIVCKDHCVMFAVCWHGGNDASLLQYQENLIFRQVTAPSAKWHIIPVEQIRWVFDDNWRIIFISS